MTNPTRPKVLPTESSIQPLPTEIPPPSISHLAQQRENALRSQYHALERILKMAMRENRVKDECLEIATEALEHYDRLGLAIPKKALAQINEHLAELEPKEESNDAT